MTIEAYPLQWPTGRPRTSDWKRERATFETTFARARDDITKEVALLTGRSLRYGGPDVIISTNTALRRDGLPLAGQRNPTDPGVAVYFHLKKGQRTEANVLAALRRDPRISTWDMSEHPWLVSIIADLQKSGAILSMREPYPWHRFKVLDAESKP